MNAKEVISRKPVTLDEETCERWHAARRRHGARSDFGCLLCGHLFEPGDTIRWIYCNDGKSPYRGGNFFVCSGCDTGDDREMQRKALNDMPNPIARERYAC